MQQYQQMLLPLAGEHDTLTVFAQLPFAEHEPFDRTPKHLSNAEEAYSFWETAVNKYSSRTLSVKTDRLSAISAVASVVAEATGDRYLAGLWRGDLLAGLAWIAQDSKARPHREYIAPTWSWASLPGEAMYPDRTRYLRGAYQAKVLKASTVWKDFGPSGGLYGPMSEVADGAIVLSRVHCDVEMTISIDSDHGKMQLNFENGEVETFHTLLYPWFQSLDCLLADTNFDQLRGNSRYLRRATDQRMGPGPCSGTVHLLWLTEDISLILTPSESLEKEGAYERLGIFHPWTDEIQKTPPKMPEWVPRSEIKLV